MLVYGTCNPAGESDTHAGVYLKRSDIERLVKADALVGLPVKIEHTGEPVGWVISAWQHDDRLDCVFRFNDDDMSIDRIAAQLFVETNRCPELSLSYNVTMQHSEDGRLSGDIKELIEVSIVKKGARHDCKIHGFHESN